MLSDNTTPELHCFSCDDSAVGEAFIFIVSQGKQKFVLIFFSYTVAANGSMSG